MVAFGPTDNIHLYDTWAKMLATHFLDMLEQKVKHVSAMKFVTDQESSRFQYVRGTPVIFVLVYCVVLWVVQGMLGPQKAY